MPSMAFAKSTQARHPLFPAEAGAFTTLQTSLHAADRTVAPPRFDPDLSTGPGRFQGMAGASLPGTLASPRTGLTPAGCRELAPGYDMTTPFQGHAPGLLDARGSRLRFGWTTQ